MKGFFMPGTYYVKTERVFNGLKRYSWLLIPLVALVGLWYPLLGLLMIPIMLLLPVMGFLKGKYWCGTICPHGSFFDGIILPVSRNKEIPSWAKSKMTLAIAFSWFMYIFATRVYKAFSFWGDTSFWEKLVFVFVVYSSRTWCRFCPMGSFQLITYKIGKYLRLNEKTDRVVTVTESNSCTKCKKCERVCPVQLVPYKEIIEKGQLEDEACIRCSTCVVNCPVKILELKNKMSA